MSTIKAKTIAAALMLAFCATAAHATAPRGGDTMPAARAGTPAPIQLAGKDDDERRRRENQEQTRKLKEERERTEHLRRIERENRDRHFRDTKGGCKYGQGKCG